MKRGGDLLGTARVTIVTGPRDSGKTRAAAAFVEAAAREGIKAGGVVAEAELLRGIKVRYTYRDVLSDARLLYAVHRLDPVPAGSPAYAFLDEGLEFGRRAVLRAVENGVDVLVVDEIGPLEMAGGGLWGPVRDAVAVFTGKMVLTVRPSLLDALRERLGLGAADVRVAAPETLLL